MFLPFGQTTCRLSYRRYSAIKQVIKEIKHGQISKIRLTNISIRLFSCTAAFNQESKNEVNAQTLFVPHCDPVQQDDIHRLQDFISTSRRLFVLTGVHFLLIFMTDDYFCCKYIWSLMLTCVFLL